VSRDRGPGSGRPAGTTAEERRRLDAVLDAAASATSLADLLRATLAALDEQFGYSRSAFMLTLARPPRPGNRAYAGVTHGSPSYMLEEYFERWADRDALASDAAAASFSATGSTTIAGIYRFLDEPRRRFVDDFLRRTRSAEQLSHRLPVGWTEGYLTLMGPDEYTERDQRLIRELAPDLVELLRGFRPRGVDAGISTREAQTAELVAVGFSNRQIADVLHVEEDTVKKHVSSAMAKLGVNRRTALAVAWATGVLMDVGGIV
jgi:DNA-binding CsgD family transcriptional regulator